MRWPLVQQRETRQAQQPFTDAIVSAHRRAGGRYGQRANPTAIAALEVAAGLYARSFCVGVGPTGSNRRHLAAVVTPDIRAQYRPTR